MKKGILKLALAFASVTYSVAAIAASNKITFFADKVDASEGSSLVNAESVNVTVNYSAKTVEIFAVRKAPVCEINMVCIAMMPAPYQITLPIKSVKKDSCGIKKVVALVDERPVDGLLTKVTLEDASSTSCQYIRQPDQRFQLTEKYMNRYSAREVTATAKALLTAKSEANSAKAYKLAEVISFAGLGIEVPNGIGGLEIFEKEVKLFLGMKLDCGINQICPQYFPRPLMLDLQIESILPSSCGTKIVARSIQAYGDLVIEEKVLITDYTNAVCEIVIPHVINVEYTRLTSSLNSIEPVQQQTIILGFK